MPDPSNQEIIWKHLAEKVGKWQGEAFTLNNIQRVKMLALRWTKSAQDAYVTNESEIVVENLDKASRAVLFNAIISIASLGVGFAAQLAIFARAGQAGRLLSGGVQMWRAPLAVYAPLVSEGATAVPALTAEAVAAGSATRIALHPLMVAPQLFLQEAARAGAQFLMFTAFKSDFKSHSGMKASHNPTLLRSRYQEWKAMTDYEKAFSKAVDEGLQANMHASKPYFKTICEASAIGKLNELRNEISSMLDKSIQKNPKMAELSVSQISAIKLSTLINLWLEVYRWAQQREIAIIQNMAQTKAEIDQLKRQADTLPEPDTSLR